MTFSGQLMITILVITAVILLARDRRKISWLVAASLPIGVAFLAAWTRSMWLGEFCGGLYLLWFWRRWAVVAVPCAIALLLLGNPFDLREGALSAFSPHGGTDSNSHRAELRAIGRKMIAAHPWLGIGPEQVSRQVQNYLPPGIPAPRPGEYYGHLENDYLQYAAERGVPTMLCLLWLIGRALFDFSRTLLRTPAEAEGRWMLHAAIAVIIAMLASGFYSWNLNGSTVLAMFLAVLGSGYVVAMLDEDRLSFSTNH
jgi:putative inorganic carbon (hco3(-)) transporter